MQTRLNSEQSLGTEIQNVRLLDASTSSLVDNNRAFAQNVPDSRLSPVVGFLEVSLA